MIKKIWHLLCRATKETLCLPGHIKSYGCKVSLYVWWHRVFLGKVGKMRYIQVLQEFMNEYLADLTAEYQKRSMILPEQPRVNTVWCCWWQGEEHMPEIVKMCVASIRAALPQSVEFVLITEKNYRDYVQIPDHIISKYHKNIIGPAHFSDILRFCLLKEYGGFWIDATILVTSSIPETWFSSHYITQRFATPADCKGEPCMGKWAGFLQCGVKENLLFHYIYDSLVKWWSEHDDTIDYVFFDYIIMTAYQHIPGVKRIIDDVPVNNTKIWDMMKLLPQTFDQAHYEELCKTQYFNKLARTLEPPKQDAAGNPTFYGYLYQNFLGECRE